MNDDINCYDYEMISNKYFHTFVYVQRAINGITDTIIKLLTTQKLSSQLIRSFGNSFNSSKAFFSWFVELFGISSFFYSYVY